MLEQGKPLRGDDADGTRDQQIPVEPAHSRSIMARLARNVLRVLLPVIVLGGAAAGFAWLKSTAPATPKKPVVEVVWPVRAVPVTIANYQPRLKLYGETVAGRRVDLRALVAGKVISASANLQDGAEVKKGERLLLIDPFIYEAAIAEVKAQLAEAKARLEEYDAALALEQTTLKRTHEQLTIAERDLARAEKLTKTGTLAQKTADDRRLIVSQRREAVEQRENNLNIQKARADQQRAVIRRLESSLRVAERNLKDTALTAPFDAYVSDVGAQLGKVLGINDKVATLTDKNLIEARVTLSDSQYGRIIAQDGAVVGRKAKLLWHIGDKPVAYQARVERVGAEIPSERGGVNIYARVLDPDKPTPIRPGAFIEMRLPDVTYDRVVRLPETALYGGDHVFIINKQGRLELRKARPVGAESDGTVLVRANLARGDLVLTSRLSAPGLGVKVKVIKAGAESDTPEGTGRAERAVKAEKAAHTPAAGHGPAKAGPSPNDAGRAHE